jgi:hypothetical protein
LKLFLLSYGFRLVIHFHYQKEDDNSIDDDGGWGDTTQTPRV